MDLFRYWFFLSSLIVFDSSLFSFGKELSYNCGFNNTATLTENNFTSPNWPQSYGNLLRCRWIITTDSNSRIEINFENFVLENHYDSLTIESGNHTRKLTGRPCLRPYISYTSSISVVFVTDSTIIREGFLATFKKTTAFPEITRPNTALCGFNAEATHAPQQLNSPGWPEPFQQNQDCMWLITAPVERTINITFYSFAISEQHHNLEILDGSNRHLYQTSTCPTHPFISTSNVVQLFLNIEGAIPSYSGFQLLFQETDECLRVNNFVCPSNSNCTSINGNYDCMCLDGYSGNSTLCADIDECIEGIHNCHDFANCTNTNGSFTCHCLEGFDGDGLECIDFDECIHNEKICDDNANCTNTNGSFICQCLTGYTGNGFSCEDVNECESNNPSCDPHAHCSNTEGGFECVCLEGFDGNGLLCTDINECTNDISPCIENANCANSEGSFECTCLEGYSGNGQSCTDIDECSNNPTLCHGSSNCVNTEGSYECVCPEAYTGNEANCADIDECASETSPCHNQATCTNTDGSFTCVCLEGYIGNGIFCTDPNAPTSFTTTSTNQPATTSNLATSDFQFCSPQTIITRDNEVYSFSRAMVHTLAFSTQICRSTRKPLASIRCIRAEPGNTQNLRERGNEVIFDRDSLQELECGITLTNLATNSSPSMLSNTLEVLTAQPDELTEEDVTTAAEILSNFQQNLDQDVSADILTSVANTVANLAAAIDSLTTDPARATAAKSKLLSTLNDLASSIVIPEDSPNGIVEVKTADINIQAARITPITRSSMGGNTTSYPEFTFDLNYGMSEGSTIVTVPPGTLDDIARASTSTSLILQATVVGNRLSLTSTQNSSQIVTVAARNASLLTKSISLTFDNVKIPNPTEKTSNPLKRILNKAEVSTWDYEGLQWNPANQCHQDNPERPEYTCRGFASYAVLFSSKEVPSILALTTVSYCGCILSIIFLSATIFVHLRHRELRRKPTTMSLINICVCLIGVYFFYIVGVGRAENKEICNAMAFMLHYFTLASIAWMSVNAMQMYRAFTQYSYSTSFSNTFTYVLSYGLPLLFVLVNFLVTVYYLDLYNNPKDIFFESLYRYTHVCWLQAPSLIWGFFLPLGILVLGNYVIFVLLLKKVVIRKRKVQSTAKNLQLTDRLLNAITMVTMMGLTWIFGYLLLISEDVTYQSVMQWLFSLTNIFQGVIIFYLYCMRRNNMRRVWLPSKISFRSVRFTSSIQPDTSSVTAVTYKKRMSTTTGN